MLTSKRTHRAFTIVELLIVIVVIAILAAITIVAFNGIQNRAVEASMKSDLRNASSQAEVDNVTNGTYPASAAAANNGTGLKSSGNNTLTYILGARGGGFCVSVNPNRSGMPSMYVTSGNTVPTTGECPPGNGVTTTFAGSGVQGSVNGTGTAAQLSYPSGVTTDRDGNVFFVQNGSSPLVRKINPSGEVTTFAGTGSAGSANGVGTAASFTNLFGITICPNGNMFVSELSSVGRIRMITAEGVVTTFAGQATPGFANGNGTAAQFSGPAGLACDASNNVYVADSSNHRIRKITPAGEVTTLAGSGTATFANGTGTGASFNFPRGVAVDAAGNVYVADYYNHRIRAITPGGVVTTLAGSGTGGSTNGNATTARFLRPEGLGIDGAGNLYASENGNDDIRKITSTGDVTTLAGGVYGFADGTGTAARFFGPTSVTISDTGTMYVADYENHRVRKVL